MKCLWSCAVFCCFMVGAGLQAAEPYLEFLSGLRGRGYFDTALQYIDQLQEDPKVPQDIRTVLPFERGMTLLENSRTSRSPDARAKLLDLAQAQLEQFAKDAPNHPLAAEANSQQANIFLGRARVSVWASDSPSNSSKKEELRNEARQLIKRARAIFQKAFEQYEAAYNKFPKFIDQQDDRQQYEARSRTEVAFLKAQLDLAQCTYEEGQTYDKGSDQRKKLLTDASLAFEEIHSKYRSMVGGLYARMWQGKCFEEQGDLQKALGIYQELLSHQDTSGTMRKLQDQVLQFKLICLNDESKKEFDLVRQEAGQWLQLAKARARTEAGLGIRWELARALEGQGMDRNRPDADRDRLLRQALEQVKVINQYPGQFKDVSTFMIRRLNVALGRDEADPRDFGTAYEIGRTMIKEIKPLKEKAEGSQATDEQRTDYELHLSENARILRLALDLSDATTPRTDLNQARYLLAYVRLLQGYHYEAAVLSEFVARHFIKEAPQSALEAAHLGLVAYVSAYNSVPKGQSNAVETERMQKMADLITTSWPDSDRANDARMTMGRTYGREGNPAKAAQSYASVPRTSPQYSEAQLSAGQAYWTAYLETSGSPDRQAVSSEELEKWRTEAARHLQTGISELEGQAPADKPAPESLTAAQVSLAQLYVSQQKYAEAIKELKDGKHKVADAIQVPQGQQRPSKGVTSEEFARFYYQLLLRSYVGLQKIDDALATMNDLEKVGSGAADTQVYTQLGQELEKELKRLKSLNETEQLNKVRESFETFLGELFKRKEGQTFSSLYWIAETYYGLGLGSDDNAQAAQEYFGKAAQTYEAILKERQDKGDEFVGADRIPGVTLRLVTCKRSSGDYSQAFDLVSQLLQSRTNDLGAQFEAARVLQAWGEKTSDKERLLAAINGQAPAWGWGQIGMRLQRAIDAGQGSDDFQEKYLQSRLASAECRRKAGQSDAAKREIEVFATISGQTVSDEWWSKFDSLYRLVQEDLGEAPQPLERPSAPPVREIAAIATPQDTTGTRTAGDSAGGATAKEKVKPAEEDSGPSIVMVIVSLLLAVGVAGGTVYAMAKPKKRRATFTAPEALPTAGAARTGTKRPAVSQRKRPPGKEGSAKGTSVEPPSGGSRKQSPGDAAQRPRRKKPPQDAG